MQVTALGEFDVGKFIVAIFFLLYLFANSDSLSLLKRFNHSRRINNRSRHSALDNYFLAYLSP